MNEDFHKRTRLNGICPYFTMFPLVFPYEILRGNGKEGDWVLDPFCGRGTTVYAGRLLGMPAIGIDSSPVAAAISEAKLANVEPGKIIGETRRILEDAGEPKDVPEGEFWHLAFHPVVLRDLCRFREEFQRNCLSDTRKALRAIILGALHGPRTLGKASYFSNQCQRTYAPKPAYAVRYWTKNGLKPARVSIPDIVETRAHRYYALSSGKGKGRIYLEDSRHTGTFRAFQEQVTWVITSPPYYGMRTYIPDQWLRLWFLGGSPEVSYSMNGQVSHKSPEEFADELHTVWKNVGNVCKPDATMVIRFGGINDRKADPLGVLYSSLFDTGWEILSTASAGFSTNGRRQAMHIKEGVGAPKEEYDVWATWRGTA